MITKMTIKKAIANFLTGDVPEAVEIKHPPAPPLTASDAELNMAALAPKVWELSSPLESTDVTP